MPKLLVFPAAAAVLAGIGWTTLALLANAGPLQMTLTKTNVDAAPEKIFALIEDFRQWGRWSPHESPDAAVRRTYSGAAKGKGAVYEWDGGEAAGAGRAQIVESTPPSRVIVGIDLARPAVGHVDLAFTLDAAGGETRIAVSANGPDAAVQKVVGMLFGDNLFGLSCAVNASPEKLCRLLLPGLPARP